MMPPSLPNVYDSAMENVTCSRRKQWLSSSSAWPSSWCCSYPLAPLWCLMLSETLDQLRKTVQDLWVSWHEASVENPTSAEYSAYLSQHNQPRGRPDTQPLQCQLRFSAASIFLCLSACPCEITAQASICPHASRLLRCARHLGRLQSRC